MACVRLCLRAQDVARAERSAQEWSSRRFRPRNTAQRSIFTAQAGALAATRARTHSDERVERSRAEESMGEADFMDLMAKCGDRDAVGEWVISARAK